jgi:multidrug efflux pump
VFSRFFIDRPIFAAVLSIVITLAGAISLFTLPLAQFPRISPATVQVQCTFPGASAVDVATAVAAPIEQYVNGVEGMMYMSSQCTNDGGYNLTVTFYQGVNLDMAQVLVQNRVTLAIPSLPEVIKATGVTTRKKPPDILMGLALNSPKGRYDQLYLSNFALRFIRDELSRLEGVADVFLFGQRDYSMRVWLDPAKLAFMGLSADDVSKAIREQNTTLATGTTAQMPVPTGQTSQYPLEVLGRLSDVEQFQNIIIKIGSEGQVVRLKHVARIELGSKNVDTSVRFDGKSTVFLAIFQLPDANALDCRDIVLAKMEELRKTFPEDVAYEVAFDTTPYTRESIHEVFNTLRDAIILVALVVLLFLQNWRSSLIPLIAVPVAIIGTFTVMAALGFSLNNLTLFGLVLAIGIVVDDAIVVVEAVEHHIENGLGPREATIKAMQQVSGPVVAVALVLSAVFVPCAFIAGITGMFFRQFALTIAVSTLISAFNSLTLSPALTALLLRPRDKSAAPPLPQALYVVLGAAIGYMWLFPPFLQRALGLEATPVVTWSAPVIAVLVGAAIGWFASRPLNRLLGWFFNVFNIGFNRATVRYTHGVSYLLRLSAIVLMIYGGLLGLTWLAFVTTPKGFIPAQDMGYLMINVQLPDARHMEKTQQVMNELLKIGLGDKDEKGHVRDPRYPGIPGIAHMTAIAGQSFVLNAAGSNFGSMFVNLKPYDERRDPSLASDKIANQLRKEFGERMFDATVAVFGPPPVRGAGRAGGFAFVVEDRGDLGFQALQEQTENLVAQGNKDPRLAGLFAVFRANVPQLRVDPNKSACEARGVTIDAFAKMLSTYQGSLYVNDFNLFGRTWQVNVQAEGKYRTRVSELSQLKVRNKSGGMVPIGSVASVREVTGPLVITRYNMYPAATINGSAAAGLSSGQAIDILNALGKKELAQAMASEWTDMSFLELLAGNTAMVIFALAVAMVFLVLAAQYESWSMPLAVILVVPMCLLSAVIGVRLAGQDINIFTQIGFVVLVGLSSKNAILIVEFAKQQREEGIPRQEATLAACRLRLRPIIMTSLAFILGVFPLMVSVGAGAEMRRTLGTAVFSGMVGVTLFGIFLTPVFFYRINKLSDAPFWNSPWMMRLKRISLGAFALGFVREVAAGVRKLRRHKPDGSERNGQA